MDKCYDFIPYITEDETEEKKITECERQFDTCGFYDEYECNSNCPGASLKPNWEDL